jgi:hypothetical protein
LGFLPEASAATASAAVSTSPMKNNFGAAGCALRGLPYSFRPYAAFMRSMLRFSAAA